jgi:hypothetical protein
MPAELEDAYGGMPRLDTLNLLENVPSDYNRQKLPWLTIIKDAIHRYRCFGLGNNISPQDFYEAYCYLFKSRSGDPGTWETKPRKNYDGMQLYCFDVHYDLSGLSNLCEMDKFLNKIKNDRKEIVGKFKDRIQDYVSKSQERCKKVGKGHQLELGMLPDLEHTMTEPGNAYEVAKLFYDSRKMSKPLKTKWRGRRRWSRSFRRRAAAR